MARDRDYKSRDRTMDEPKSRFDAETWAQLPELLDNLPEPVRLVVWGDPDRSAAEKEAAGLGRTLANHFGPISFAGRPRRANYPYYPVIGVMGLKGDEEVDYGLRLIGLPSGVQMTSLIAAIQAVAFHGMTLEAKTRIALHRLAAPVTIEVIGAADVAAAAVMAKTAFDMAAASPMVRSYFIMGDAFPEAVIRYSIDYLPHTVINGRAHISGVAGEAAVLQHIAAALR
jgi:alkyl hydroperoxide reductase subunit AhpF